MTNHLKVFENETAYSAFTGSSAYVTPNVSVCSGGGGSIFYNPYVHDYSKDYLTFTTSTSGSFGIFENGSGTTSNTISYSIDDGNSWSPMTYGVYTDVFPSGTTVMMKGTLVEKPSAEPNSIGTIQSTCKFSAYGNIMSLVNGDNFVTANTISNYYEFFKLFFNNSNLISAENLSLPATTLAYGCYNNMFRGCTSLTSAPELPAATLAPYCYNGMFSGCTSLTSAPELPAMTLAGYCYQYMFNGCTGLTTAPELPAMTLADNCYQYMFNGCTSLATAPSLPATTLAEYCYQSMFRGCTSLTSAPELPATTLTDSCYTAMFRGCTSLTTAPELSATTLAQYCYENMFQGCSSLTTAPSVLPAETLAGGCYNGMFQGCTSLTIAPALPARTLTSGCYASMFRDCTSLNNITCLATDISAYGCTSNWVSGVAASGTFTKAASMTGWGEGANGIPTGWTTVDKS